MLTAGQPTGLPAKTLTLELGRLGWQKPCLESLLNAGVFTHTYSQKLWPAVEGMGSLWLPLPSVLEVAGTWGLGMRLAQKGQAALGAVTVVGG